jgi:hypothetical protein
MTSGLEGMSETRAGQALELMLGFADRTGLTTNRAPDRYLWTDAFAVCCFLGLGRTELALRLVDQVHQTLGRHRPDDARTGWISGLDRLQGEAHPTSGGLRIGKKLPERLTDEPVDDRLEWDREGQYFHYLTRWMHALDQVARWTAEPRFNIWARELAVAAHRAFAYGQAAGPRRGDRQMYWKMSVDLSRPLVWSMGQHDPLDGYITCVQLEWTASILGAATHGPRLADQAADFARMIPPELTTTDPLGLGGLLTDASRVAQLTREGAMQGEAVVDRLLDAALVGLVGYERSGELYLPASHRLAFRELGLAIGLAAIPFMDGVSEGSKQVMQLIRLAPLREKIEEFWLAPENRRAATWLEHENSNDVMLATSLTPAGYLTLRS